MAITKDELLKQFDDYQKSHGRNTDLYVHKLDNDKRHYRGWMGDMWQGWVESALCHRILDPDIPDNHDLSFT